MSLLEAAATLFGFICVVLTIRQNIWCWPAGLVQVTLYIPVFYAARLYSDMLLHAIYVLMQFYGWYNWLYGGPERGLLPVAWLRPAGRLFWALAAVGGTVGLGTSMDRWFGADLPYWDAATTVLSLMAQWLMAKKIMESWLMWITVDILAVGIYYYKALYLTCGLYAVFLVLATLGFLEWRRSYCRQAISEPLIPAGQRV
ncbi:MAG: nicotinamide mononucleotide transporter [Acidobacteria bacterium]|nr:nicotinamide mononucleotide transporter [Acidobacteriota bacterium]